MSYYNTGFSFNPLGTTGPPEPGEPFPVSHKTTLPEGLSTAHSPRDIAPLSSGSGIRGIKHPWRHLRATPRERSSSAVCSS